MGSTEMGPFSHISKEAFIEWQARVNGLSVKQFEAMFDVQPCDCGWRGCPGWQAELKPAEAREAAWTR